MEEQRVTDFPTDGELVLIAGEIIDEHLDALKELA